MLKVAIIGAGNIAQNVHIPSYQGFSQVSVVAISDLDQKKLDEVASLFNIKHKYTDYKVMIQEVQPDIVSICTPNRFHYEQTLFALDHGAHVFCEKPPALSYQQAKHMHEKAIENKKVLAFNFHHRFRQEATLMKDAMDIKGQLPYFVEVHALRRRGIPGWGVFTNHDLQGGGALIDIGVHMLDLALYVLKFPTPKFALATKSNLIGKQGGTGDFGDWKGGDDFSVEDSLFGVITFENGLIMEVKTSFTYHMKEKSVMNVTMHTKDCAYHLVPSGYTNYLEQVTHELKEKNTLFEGVKSFVTHILGDEKVTFVDSSSVLVTQLIVEMLYQSSIQGKPISMESII